MPTPHNSAEAGAFAKTVLMPGDPLRAKYVAEHFLEDAQLVNNVRGVQGYTGFFEGARVSVMASGMGMPSIAIYSHELFSQYGVENIIRIGSAGALLENIRLRDLVFGMGACTNSRFAHTFSLPGDFAPIADYGLLSRAVRLASREGFRFHVGNLLSSDTFYNDEEGLPKEQTAAEKWRKMGVLAIEMEAAALYMNAARLRKRALAICTISDHILTGEASSPLERQESYDEMIRLALLIAKEEAEEE